LLEAKSRRRPKSQKAMTRQSPKGMTRPDIKTEAEA